MSLNFLKYVTVLFLFLLSFSSVNSYGFHEAYEVWNGTFSSGKFIFQNELEVKGDLISPKICLDGDCRTTWPAGSGNSGDITSVNAGAGLIGGAVSDDVFLSLNFTYLDSLFVADSDLDLSIFQNRVNSSCAIGSSIRVINIDGSVICEVDSLDVDTNTQLSEAEVDSYVSNNGYSIGAHTVDTNTNAGTICSVGEYLDGDGTCKTANTVIDTNTNAGTICSAGEFLNGDGTCDAVIVDTNSGGDITGVTAGTGLTGGGNTGAVTLNFDTAYGDGRYINIGEKSTDSNLLDGVDSGSFLRSDTTDTATGELFFTNGAVINTASNTKNFFISRLGGKTNEYLSIGTDDTRTYFNRKNDETTAIIRFNLEATDTETGGGVAANSGYIEFLTNTGGVSINLNGDDVATENWVTGQGFSVGAHTVDTNTNAGTICSAGEFLNGDGTCDAVIIDTNSGGDITGVTAGTGLTGGGTTGAPTLNVGAGSGITVAADTVSVSYLPALDDRDVKPSVLPDSTKSIRSYFTSLGGLTGSANTDYQDLLVMDTYSDPSGGKVNALAFDKSLREIKHYQANYGATSWGAPETLAYKSWVTSQGYSTTNGDITGVTAGTGLTGGGASGAVTLNVADNYVLNTGDTMTGILSLVSTGYGPLKLERTGSSSNLNIEFKHPSATRFFGIDSFGNFRTGTSADLQGSGNILYHNGNSPFDTEAEIDAAVANNGYSIGAHTIDTNTNAGTICSAGQFLNGDGTCDAVVVDTNSGGDITGVTAGTGLTGGGTTGTPTLNVGAGIGILSNANDVAINTGYNNFDVEVENNGIYIASPGGAKFETHSSTQTGALAITLPVSWTSTMMRFAIDVYDYAADESITIYVGGYNYATSSAWVNTFAQIISSRSDKDFNVRFGHDGSKVVVYVGETSSTWGYSQVVVRDFYAGFNAAENENTWDDGWSISYETTLGTITATESANYIYSDWNNMKNIPAGFADGSDANTQLSEATVDSYANNNGYSTGAHTVDTNTHAGTICGNGLYLNGDGGCYPLSNTDGDITGVTAGTGISGGGTSGTVTVTATLGASIQETEIEQNTLDDSEIQDNSLTALSLAPNSVGISELQLSLTPNSASEIPGGVDLNTYQTAGFYYQTANADASSGTNYPTAQAGSLIVQKSAGVTQQYHVYGSANIIYIRAYYNSAWSPWRLVYHTGNSPYDTEAEIDAAVANNGYSIGAHTVDTNTHAGTICSNGLFLNGDGTCDALSNNVGDITGVTAGTGLTGGGSSGTPTLNVGAGTGITVAADTVALNTGYTDGRYLNTGYLNGITVADANSADNAGISSYYLTSGAANKPTGTDHSLLTMSFSNAWSTQMAGDWRTNNYYVREQNNGVWGGWDKIWTSGNDGSGSGLDADTIDGVNSGTFMRATTDGSYYGLTDPAGSTSQWIRTTTNGIIPATSGGASSLGTSSWPFSNIYGNNIYDNGVELSAKFLGISAKAADANLLDGMDSSALNHKSYNVRNYLGAGYISGGNEKPNWFGSGKVQGQMLSDASIGGGRWMDVLWLSTYTGGDVKRSNALWMAKTGGSDIYLTQQNYDSTSWGTAHLLWNSGNDGAGSGLSADNVDGISSASFLRADADDTFSGALISSARNSGVFGTYDSTKTDQIWSMGTAYRNHASGTNFGNLYGLAYKHTNNPTGGTMAGGHQMVWTDAGSPRSAMGYGGFWTVGSYTGAAFYYSSDETLKTNITVLNSSLDKIKSLRGVNFNWIESGDFEVGLIAQEVEKIYPELVNTDAEGLKSVKYGNLVAPLIEAVKEQDKKIESQQIQIDELREMILELKNE